jgi:hypothetical protein
MKLKLKIKIKSKIYQKPVISDEREKEFPIVWPADLFHCGASRKNPHYFHVILTAQVLYRLLYRNVN